MITGVTWKLQRLALEALENRDARGLEIENNRTFGESKFICDNAVLS